VRKRCQVNGCKQSAKYALYKTYDGGEKVWIQVCDQHEKEIGSENLKRAGGRIYEG